jgi:predicted phage terminase large subunit-like protein
MRITGQTGVVEAGLVFLPHEAAWLDDCSTEPTVFPNGRHDDQVDSTSQALAHLTDGGGVEAFLQLMKDHNDWFRRQYG